MKLILLEDVKGLGKKEAVVDVNDGYARNFLLPKKLALEANASNMNLLNSKKQSEAKQKEREVASAKKMSDTISTLQLVIKTKAGESGRLFGSITSKDVSEKLKELHGIDVDKKKIEMPDHIKCIGSYTVDVKLYTGITAKLSIIIKEE